MDAYLREPSDGSQLYWNCEDYFLWEYEPETPNDGAYPLG